MKILICGDVVGRAGRNAVLEHIPALRKERNLDFVILNGDNASSGFGINRKQCLQFLENGSDVITCGDHVWDQQDTKIILSEDKRVLRPHNYPASVAGSGFGQYRLPDGRMIVVIHLLGQVFIKDNLNCPFFTADALLKNYQLGSPSAAAIIVDFHAEATSEKCAMGVHLDGKVSAVVGTHTHVPTSDTRILAGGTGYQTDLGMCGDYNNTVIGFDPEIPLEMFRSKIRKGGRMTPKVTEGTLCGMIVETDDKTGLATSVERIHIGGALTN